MEPVATPSASNANGESTLRDLFALSDEQILEIEPELNTANSSDSAVASGKNSAASHAQVTPATGQQSGQDQSPSTSHPSPQTNHESRTTSHQAAQREAQPEMAVPPEPPAWLAAQMKDPWAGEEAREFWNGVQQARTEAAAYRASIASPEDARALKELYPGGIVEARAAADRARLLNEIDRAYFGAAGKSPEQTSASRAQLAQRMLREDPAAFREMVIAGLRALEEAEKGTGAARSPDLPRLAKVFANEAKDVNVAPPFRAASSAVDVARHAEAAGRNFGAATGQQKSPVTSHESLSAYGAFERAANEDLERSVGAAIERTLEQALPVAQPLLAVRGVKEAQGQGTQARVPALRERLTAAVRQDVEQALQGDRQLGEQVAQILASRRFDNDTRAQVVRLINERAQQLVPGAAKRILNEWTQTTLAAHRSRTQREDSVARRVDLAPAEVAPVNPEHRSASLSPRPNPRNADPRRQDASATKTPRRVDYRKLSDEQILDMG